MAGVWDLQTRYFIERQFILHPPDGQPRVTDLSRAGFPLSAGAVMLQY